MKGRVGDSTSLKVLFDTVIKNDYCIGCGACASLEKSPISIKLDEFGRYRPFLASDPVQDIDLPSVCPFSDKAKNEDELGLTLFGKHGKYDGRLGYVMATYAGYAIEGDYRKNGSSGGIGSWILTEMMHKGMVDKVIHVHPKAPSSDNTTLFQYSVSSTVAEISQGSKSHYYPVEMSEMLQEVRKVPGKYAIVGIPCFIKAVRLLQKQDPILAERIKFTIGLVCGYLPTTRFAELFSWQAGIHPDDLIQINFRKKDPNRPVNRYMVEVSSKNQTKEIPFNSSLGSNWGNGFFKHNACDYCDDIVSETADITIGDAWLPKFVNDSQGTNIIIVRNNKMLELIESARAEGRLYIEDLSAEEAVTSQAPAFRHRREGLAYRLHLTEKRGEWHPPKRVEPNAFRLSYFFRKTHEYRMRLAKESHIAFQSAIEQNNFSAFEMKMNPLVRKYHMYIAIPQILRKIRKKITANLPRMTGTSVPIDKIFQSSAKVVTIINHVDSLNLGDASLLYMTVSLVDEALQPERINVVSFNLKNDSEIMNLLKHTEVRFLQSPIRADHSGKVRMVGEMIRLTAGSIYSRLAGNQTDSHNASNSVLDAIRSSDLVIVRGGDNLADTYGPLSLAAQLYHILLALILKKKIVILGTSIGPFKNGILRKVTSFFLRRMDLIVVRDIKSKNALRQEGVNENRVKFIPDITFDLPAHRDSSYDQLFDEGASLYVGIGVSALSARYIEKDRLAKLVAKLCDHITSTYKAKVILIPHVLSQFNDEEFAKYVHPLVSNKENVIIVRDTNPMKIKHIISRLDLLVSFRMHPLVHALSLGVPVIGVDYNEKAEELLKIFQMDKWIVHIQDLDKLQAMVDKSLSDHVAKERSSLPRIERVSDQYIGLLQRMGQAQA